MKESTNLPLLKKQLAETEKGINNMLNAIQAGIFTPSTKQRLIDSFENGGNIFLDSKTKCNRILLLFLLQPHNQPSFVLVFFSPVMVQYSAFRQGLSGFFIIKLYFQVYFLAVF